MKKILLIISLLSLSTKAQEVVLVKFKDKPQEQFYLENPQEMLSLKSIERKQAQGILIDQRDVPVETSYIQEVKNIHNEIISVSKWFNGLVMELNPEEITQIQALNCVEEMEYFASNLNPENQSLKVENQNKFQNINQEYTYGSTSNQTELINIDKMHQAGYTGEGVSIAVFDSGFPTVNTTAPFQKARDENRIHSVYNFWDNSTDVYQGYHHGTQVLSTIIAQIENEFVGTAPDVNAYLFATEYAPTETPNEVAHWVRAAEISDSIGVDLINTSLGYTTFDDAKYNYTYADMNGETTYISRAAKILAEKGVLLVTSAGNDGNKSWHYISAPADAKNVLTIGSVTSSGTLSSFSSYGPSSDGRIKPNVTAMGSSAAVINTSGQVTSNSGTSFSSPILAGAMACMIQKEPNKTAEYYIDKVQNISHLKDNPNNSMGWGIPNFEHISLANQNLILSSSAYKYYPNPSKGIFNLSEVKNIQQIVIYNLLGQKIKTISNSFKQLNLSKYKSGIYIVEFQDKNNRKYYQKISIKNE